MKYFILALFISLNFILPGQQRILIDGKFDDWANSEVVYDDALGDEGFSGIDFEALKISNDGNYLFIQFENTQEFNFQSGNDVSIYIDTDMDVSTGFSVDGIGAEVEYSFGQRSGRVRLGSNTYTIFHNDLGLVSAPTVSSKTFELAINRELSLFGFDLLLEEEIRVVLKDNGFFGDVMPQNDGGIVYNFSNDNAGPLPNYSIQKTNENHFRFLSYNVLFNGLMENRAPSFQRILRAIQPDIIGFQEIYDYSSGQVAAQVESMLPSNPGQHWYHAKGGPDNHVISRYPVLQAEEIDGISNSQGNGAFLLDVPGIPQEVLFIVAHTPCCENDDARQFEVDAIMAFVRDAKNGTGPIVLQEGAPIIIVGDMNLVGESQQLQTLLEGNIVNEFAYGPDFTPDWDGTDFQDSRPITTNTPMAFTWFNEGSSFSPGRLDFIIYSGSNLQIKNSFNLFSRALPQDSLNAYNLFQEDTPFASDHLPVVVDFETDVPTSIEDPELVNHSIIKNVWPNPANDNLHILVDLDHSGSYNIVLTNAVGKQIYQRTSYLIQGESPISLDISPYPAGVYFVKILGTEMEAGEKIIISQ